MGTGSPTREFLYVEDAAEGIVTGAERYNDADPVNLGSGYEITSAISSRLSLTLTGFKGELVWQVDQPDGQPRRGLDVSRAPSALAFAQGWIFARDPADHRVVRVTPSRTGACGRSVGFLANRNWELSRILSFSLICTSQSGRFLLPSWILRCEHGAGRSRERYRRIALQLDGGLCASDFNRYRALISIPLTVVILGRSAMVFG